MTPNKSLNNTSLREIATTELFTKLDKLFLTANINTFSFLTGQRKSGVKGSSLDFSDYRPYTQGDDLRKIDWNSFARTEKTNIKLFNEEKQASVNIFIDTSKSMDFGKNLENKFFYAKLIAVCFAYISLKESDCVSIYAFDEKITKISNNISSKQKINQLITRLDNTVITSNINSITSKDFSKIKLNTGISIVISDFYSDDIYKIIGDNLLKHNQKVFLIQIITTEEENPTLDGSFTLLDCEDNSELNIELTPDIIEEYKKTVKLHKNKIKQYSTQKNIIFNSFSTDINILELINKILRLR